MREWIPIADSLPPRGLVVDTMIDDEDGVRNERPLMRAYGSNLWWLPDGSMYVYYTPTHWRRSNLEGVPK